jgi:sugar phosphate isomerase/epimerase
MSDCIMKYGITTNYFREYSPEDMILCFASKNWLALELSDEHVDMLLERDNPNRESVEFKRYANDHGITFPQGHLLLQADIVDDDPVIIDKLKSWLDIFMILDINVAVLHPGGAFSRRQGKSLSKIRSRQLEVLDILTQYIENTDLTICIENTPDTETSVDGLLEIINLCSSDKLGICLDTGHLNMAGGDQADFILKADRYLKALHIHGNDGKSDMHIMPYGQSCYEGYIDWIEVVRALKKIGYKGLFNLEIGGEGACPYKIKMAKLDYLDMIIPMILSEDVNKQC